MRKPKIFISYMAVLIIFCAVLSGCGRNISSIEYRTIVGFAPPGADDESAVTHGKDPGDEALHGERLGGF